MSLRGFHQLLESQEGCTKPNGFRNGSRSKEAGGVGGKISDIDFDTFLDSQKQAVGGLERGRAAGLKGQCTRSGSATRKEALKLASQRKASASPGRPGIGKINKAPLGPREGIPTSRPVVRNIDASLQSVSTLNMSGLDLPATTPNTSAESISVHSIDQYPQPYYSTHALPAPEDPPVEHIRIPVKRSNGFAFTEPSKEDYNFSEEKVTNGGVEKAEKVVVEPEDEVVEAPPPSPPLVVKPVSLPREQEVKQQVPPPASTPEPTPKPANKPVSASAYDAIDDVPLPMPGALKANVIDIDNMPLPAPREVMVDLSGSPSPAPAAVPAPRPKPKPKAKKVVKNDSTPAQKSSCSAEIDPELKRIPGMLRLKAVVSGAKTRAKWNGQGKKLRLQIQDVKSMLDDGDEVDQAYLADGVLERQAAGLKKQLLAYMTAPDVYVPIFKPPEKAGEGQLKTSIAPRRRSTGEFARSKVAIEAKKKEDKEAAARKKREAAAQKVAQEIPPPQNPGQSSWEEVPIQVKVAGAMDGHAANGGKEKEKEKEKGAAPKPFLKRGARNPRSCTPVGVKQQRPKDKVECPKPPPAATKEVPSSPVTSPVHLGSSIGSNNGIQNGISASYHPAASMLHAKLERMLQSWPPSTPEELTHIFPSTLSRLDQNTRIPRLKPTSSLFSTYDVNFYHTIKASLVV